MQHIDLIPGFPADARAQAAQLFWAAFGGKLGRVMRPEARARSFFERALNPDFAISAVDKHGQLLGIAGFETADGAMTGGTWSDLKGAYGVVGGLWRAPLLSLLERPVEPGVLRMDGICVAPAARGRGVGTALLGAIKIEARRQGLPAIRLDVIDTNPRARALYERQGFVVQGHEDIGSLRHLFGFRHSTRMQFNLLPGAICAGGM